jgi:putative ABC transport system permease protein
MRAIKGRLVMVLECVVMSIANIMHNRMRSFLTILGIMIGVTAVIALITTITGVSDSLSSSFSSMGAGSLSVSVTGSDLKDGLSAEDLRAIANLDYVDGLTPSVSLSSRISKGGTYESSIQVSGKNAYYFTINPDAVARGRALNVVDEDNMTFVCLINQDMVDEFSSASIPWVRIFTSMP